MPECRAMQLSAAFERPLTKKISPRQRIAGLREGLNDLLTSASLLPAVHLRQLAVELSSRHGLDFDSLQKRRLGRIATVR